MNDFGNQTISDNGDLYLQRDPSLRKKLTQGKIEMNKMDFRKIGQKRISVDTKSDNKFESPMIDIESPVSERQPPGAQPMIKDNDLKPHSGSEGGFLQRQDHQDLGSDYCNNEMNISSNEDKQDFFTR